MKKLVKILIICLCCFSVCLLVLGCASGTGKLFITESIYKGELSELTYFSEEDVLSGFVKNECYELNSRYKYVDNQVVRELSSSEIAKLKQTTKTEILSGKEMIVNYRQSFYEYQTTVYLLKYKDHYRYYTVTPKDGEGVTKGYYSFLCNQMENCTVSFYSEEIIKVGDIQTKKKETTLVCKYTKDAVWFDLKVVSSDSSNNKNYLGLIINTEAGLNVFVRNGYNYENLTKKLSSTLISGAKTLTATGALKDFSKYIAGANHCNYLISGNQLKFRESEVVEIKDYVNTNNAKFSSYVINEYEQTFLVEFGRIVSINENVFARKKGEAQTITVKSTLKFSDYGNTQVYVPKSIKKWIV